MLAAGLQSITIKYRSFSWQAVDQTKVFSKLVLEKGLFITVILMALLIPSNLWREMVGFDPYKQVNYPEKEIEFIMNNYPNHKFFNNYDIGGFQILASKGKIKTFIDGRSGTAFPAKVGKDYIRFYKNESSWPAMLDSYGINGIILANDHVRQIVRLNTLPEWKIVYKGSKATVYIKN